MKKIQCDWMEGYNKRNKLVKLEAKVYKDFLCLAEHFYPFSNKHLLIEVLKYAIWHLTLETKTVKIYFTAENCFCIKTEKKGSQDKTVTSVLKLELLCIFMLHLIVNWIKNTTLKLMD